MYTIAPLTRDHYLEFFDCRYDDNKLGEWLKNHGLDFHERNQARLWIMCDQNDLESPVGYFSLSAFQLSGDLLSRKQRGGIPKSESQPAHLLGKFALDTKVQGAQAGTWLMREVFRKYMEAKEISGTRFLVLHANHEKLEQFYKGFGFETIRTEDLGGSKRYLMAISSESVEQTLAQVAPH